MAEIIYVNHTAECLPGDAAVVGDDEGRRLVEAGMARYATKEDAEAIVRATVDAEVTANAEADAERAQAEQLQADAAKALTEAKHTRAAAKK